MKAHLLKVGVGIAAMALIAGCSSEPAESDDGESPSTSGSTGEPADGVLNIGAYFPFTGSIASYGQASESAVNLAIADIEAAGRDDWELDVTLYDSGDTTTDIATQSVTAMIDGGADVIVGPHSSGVTFTTIDQVIGAGVVQIATGTTAPDLGTYDDDGWFWRTAPNDALQGTVLGNLVIGDGHETVGILYINDPAGVGLFEETRSTIEELGGSVVADVNYNPNDTVFNSQIDELMSQNPDAIIMMSQQAHTAAMLPEILISRSFPASNLYFNDGSLSNDYDLPEGALSGAIGVQPGNPDIPDFHQRLLEDDPSITTFNYAAEGYDAVILAALAAIQGGDDSSQTIRDNLQSVSRDGTQCYSFAECAELLDDGVDIDYEGQSGPITFGDNGDPTEAYIGVFQFDETNTFSLLRAEAGSLE